LLAAWAWASWAVGLKLQKLVHVNSSAAREG